MAKSPAVDIFVADVRAVFETVCAVFPAPKSSSKFAACIIDRPARWTPAGDTLYTKTEKGAYNLWKQNLNGGEPKQYTDFNSQAIYNYAFSRGDKRLAHRARRCEGECRNAQKF